MIKSFFATVAFALFIPISSFCQLENADKNADIKKVAEAAEKLNTIECAFERTSKMFAVADIVKEKGTFFFQAPDKLCMKYENGESLVVSDNKVSMEVGGKARTLRAGNRHVEDLSSTLLACVVGKVSEIEGTLKCSKTKGNNVVFTISTDMNVGRSRVTTVEIAYDKKTSLIVSLNLIEEDGSYTLYDLKEKAINTGVDASLFVHASKEKRKR